MKVLVIGNGGREHAIARKMRKDSRSVELFVAPGNAGTSQIAQNVPIAITGVEAAVYIERLVSFARQNDIDLTVVGPDQPLADGIVDRFQEAELLVFGPTKAAAKIEWSKRFAKELMDQIGVPTGHAEFFVSCEDALHAVRKHDFERPLVVKPDELSGGKRVTVTRTKDKAEQAVKDLFVKGHTVLLEEFLEGQEVSVFAFVDGEKVSSVVTAVDYKPLGVGDTGPNTGGMGSFSPPSPVFWSANLGDQVRREIVVPVARELAKRGIPFKGVLYAGLILTAQGPMVLEFNCRFGDPEAQVILPRLKTDLLEVMLAIARGVPRPALEWDSRACVGVVMASGRYPYLESYPSYPIEGLDEMDEDVVVFHAGTKKEDGKILTDGGRVLIVVAYGDTLEEARERAYANVRRIRFTDAIWREDIAFYSN